MSEPNAERLHERIAKALRERIRGGALEPGEPLPTQAELGETFAASRLATRRALELLESEGLIDRRRGGRATVRRPGPGRIHSVSVAGVAVRPDGKVLTIQRADNGLWAPPGGVLERDETFEQGVVREIHEETGVVVAAERLTGVYKNVRLGVVALVYRCRPVSGEPHPTEEARAVEWLTVEEACARMLPAFAVRVTDALGDVAASRAHDGVDLL